MVLYIQNSKDATRKLLELISEFSKVIGFKINTELCCISTDQQQKIKKEKEKLRKQFHLPYQK